MKYPTFSIIIPAHNEEDVIERAIKSIQKQSFHDFEIIISNDGSTDKTQEIVESMIKGDRRIRILNRKKGHSAAFARNRGAEIAKGKILVFLDADTFMSFNSLEKILKSKKHADAFAFDCIPENKTAVSYALSGLVLPIKAKQSIYSNKDKDPLMFFCVTRRAFKKIGGYDESIFYFEDADFAQRFYKAGFKTIFITQAKQYFELPSDLSGFFRQCQWIAKGLNSIKKEKERKRIKLFWVLKLLFVVSPLSFVKTTLFLPIALITIGMSYLMLFARNKNPIKSLASLPLLYAKILIVNYFLIKKSIMVRCK